MRSSPSGGMQREANRTVCLQLGENKDPTVFFRVHAPPHGFGDDVVELLRDVRKRSRKSWRPMERAGYYRYPSRKNNFSDGLSLSICCGIGNMSDFACMGVKSTATRRK